MPGPPNLLDAAENTETPTQEIVDKLVGDVQVRCRATGTRRRADAKQPAQLHGGVEESSASSLHIVDSPPPAAASAVSGSDSL